MAASVSGVLSVTPSGAPVEGMATVSLVLTNSGDADATVTDISPFASPLGQTVCSVAATLGKPNVGSGLTVAKSNGTLTITWPVIMHSTAPSISATTFAWLTLGASVLLSTGLNVYPTTVNFGCTSLPNTTKSGLLDFSKFENSGSLMLI